MLTSRGSLAGSAASSFKSRVLPQATLLCAPLSAFETVEDELILPLRVVELKARTPCFRHFQTVRASNLVFYNRPCCSPLCAPTANYICKRRRRSKHLQDMAAGAFTVGSMIMNTIVNFAILGLCIQQTFMYSARDDAGELFFDNFSLVAKSVSCFKMFITAYQSVQTKGSEMFALVCLMAFFLHLYAITTHLTMNRRAWARTRIIGMAALMAAGVFLLCRGMVIPKDHPWHTAAIPAIIIFTVLLEACVLIHKQIKEDGGNQNSLRDLQVTVAEMLIAIYQFVDYVGNTHSPWVAEKILHLVGNGLPVLIGACHVGWIAYKAGIISKVVEWLRNNPLVLAGEEEQVAGGIAAVSDGDCDAEGRVGEEGVGIVVTVLA